MASRIELLTLLLFVVHSRKALPRFLIVAHIIESLDERGDRGGLAQV
jgi:hypothetical protein